MKIIQYGDRTKNGTGHPLDMHYGAATLPYNPRRQAWALPGSTGLIPGLGGRVVAKDWAEKLIVRFDLNMQKWWIKKGEKA